MTKQERALRQEEMFGLVEACLAGNQSQRAFCKEHGIAYHVFHYWRKKYHSLRMKDEFIELPPPSDTTTGIQINYPNGVNIRVSSGASTGLLSRLIQLL